MRRLRGRPQTLRALLADTAGNTMLMMAAGMIPIIGMAGSAFDMSRAYMVKTRLQQACDAGVLAGRRAMTQKDFDDDAAAIAEADKFFDFNYPDSSFGTSAVTFNATGTADGQVEGTARATVPMTLMQMFATPSLSLDVNCDAILEVANTDVMFVLDVTGSMNCAVGEDATTCPNGNNNETEKTTSKIRALRTAVVGFYDTLDAAVSDEARLRFGFVPYSSSINVGNLLSSSQIVDTHEYQSRVAVMTSPFHVATQVGSVVSETEIFEKEHAITEAACTKYKANQSFNNGSGGGNGKSFTASPAASANAPTANTVYGYGPTGDATVVDWGWSDAKHNTGDKRSCRRKRTSKSYTYVTRYKLANYIYRSEPYNVASYKAGSAVNIASSNLETTSATNSGVPDGVAAPNPSWVGTSGTYDMIELAAQSTRNKISTTSHSWNKCIHERKTLAQASYASIPTDAYDLDIDLAATTQDSKWRPTFVQLLYRRNFGLVNIGGNNYIDYNDSLADETTTATSNRKLNNGNESCVKPAQKLQVMTKAQVQAYVSASSGFKAIGSTYHDFGMVWGARLLSPTGIFGSENLTAPNGKQINRHLVFMSDGQMQPSTEVYGLQGWEQFDRRVTGGVPNSDDLRNRHNARFAAMCEAIKAKNITVWVVAYGTTLSDDMRDCADEGRAFTANDDAQLKTQFETIASKIAELRLAE